MTKKIVATEFQPGDSDAKAYMINAIDWLGQAECKTTWIYHKMNLHEYTLAHMKQVKVKQRYWIRKDQDHLWRVKVKSKKNGRITKINIISELRK